MIKALVLAWFIANFEPLQDILNKYLKPYIKLEYLRNSLSCWKCLAFWITLFSTFDIYLSSGAAMIAYIISRLLLAIPIRF